MPNLNRSGYCTGNAVVGHHGQIMLTEVKMRHLAYACKSLSDDRVHRRELEETAQGPYHFGNFQIPLASPTPCRNAVRLMKNPSFGFDCVSVQNDVCVKTAYAKDKVAVWSGGMS